MKTPAFLLRLLRRILPRMDDLKPHTYRMLGGGSIQATTPHELLHHLRAASRNPEADDATFMAETAEAARIYSGAVVRTTGAPEFIADLIVAGFLVDEADPGAQLLPFPPPPPGA